MPESLWTRIADLPLVVETHALERLAASAGEQERITTHVRLRGRGADGLGEEIGMPEDQAALVAASDTLPLEGEWTLASFIDHLGHVDLWSAPPEWEMARRWRSWAFESAALDLALRQAGLGLPEALDRTPAPVRFVNSLGLGDPPEVATIERRLERYPALRFKLDAQASWSPELIDGVTATGAVDIIDFKGRYGLPVDDETALVAVYDGVLARLDGVILEDPHELPEVEALVAPHARRVSFDAPIATVDDVTGAAFGARIVNIKPSRIGSVRTLLDIYAHSEAEGLQLYGGGMGEIGVGRGQVELLAALFHPDGPNDVAPSAYNMPDLPGGLPRSPLTPPERVTGFRWG